jgi:uncharacterized protein YjbI with pentapeptide repeats
MIAIRPLLIEVQVIFSVSMKLRQSKTNEEAYQETHKERPSNEIQTTLNLLFKKHKHGLYAQDFAKQEDFPWADLSHAYLVKADFGGAQCQGASFKYAQCQGVNFCFAQYQGVNFWHAHWFLNEHVNRGFAQFAGDIYPPPMPIHARYKSRLCVPKFHLILIN